MSHEDDPSIPLWLAYSLAVIAGVAMTTQAHINGLLGAELGNGIVAAALSFAGGLAVLIGIAIFSRRVRVGLRSTRRSIDTREISWVFTLAGVAGAGFVFSQSAVSPVIGLALFSVSFVCGLTIGGLLMDVWGVGPAGHRAVTPLRLLGAVLGIVAVIIAVSGSLDAQRASAMIAIPAMFGVGVAWQQAANGRLTRVNRNPWSTTLINFGVGFGALMLGVLVIAMSNGLPTRFPENPWLYVGGPVGIAFIAIASVVVRYIGILIYGLCATTGQLVSAVVFDALDSNNSGISASIVIGALVVAAGTAVASLSGRWSRAKRR
jgi:transporter family-2 protein